VPAPMKEDASAPDTAPAGDEAPLPPEPPKLDQAANTWAWTSWWSRPDGYTEAAKAASASHASVEEASSTPLPGPTPSEEPDAKAKGLDGAGETGVTVEAANTGASIEPTDVNAETKDTPPAVPNPAARNTGSGSWFWLWSNAQNVQANSPPPQQPAKEFFTPNTYSDQATDLSPQVSATTTSAEAPVEAPPTAQAEAPLPSTAAAESTQEPPKGQAKASGWAFWYREPVADTKPADGQAQKHVGEVAVFDTPSQSHPEAAQFNEQEAPKSDTPEPAKQPPKPKESLVKKSLGSLRGRSRKKTASQDLSNETPTITPTASAPVTPARSSPEREPSSAQITPVPPSPKQAHKAKQEPVNTLKPSTPPNLIFPEFQSTYRLAQQPSFWKQVRQYFLGGEPAAPHLHINPAPQRIKKAVAIGVHGFFPAPIFQRIMGQPTGTSIRFANAAAAAIKEWSEARGYCPEIEQVALEGEGFIAERVNTLWKLLLNWIDHIKEADFILVACHSQGVPVAMMLVAKLIQFGCVNATRIGVCAMAGVNMGPFIEYKTKYFGPTAAELFEFSDPKSLVSQMYLAALDEVLRFGVRILYVGSIDDQLVSLEVSRLHYLHLQFSTDTTTPVIDLLHPLPPLHLPRRLRRRPHPRARLPHAPRRLHPQAAQPGSPRPRPDPRALPGSSRQPLRRRGPLARLRGPARLRPRRIPRPRNNQPPHPPTVFKTPRQQRQLRGHQHPRRRRDAQQNPKGGCPQAARQGLRDPRLRGDAESVLFAVGDARAAGGGLCQEGVGRRGGGAAGLV
jgi:hypothetical protein